MAIDDVVSFLKEVTGVRSLPLEEQETQVVELMAQYGTKLDGYPEAQYLQALVRLHGDYDGIPMSILDSPIEELGLSTRDTNSLYRAMGFYPYEREPEELVYIGNLVQRTEPNLLRIKGVGRGTLDRVNESFEELCPILRLGLKIPYVHLIDIPKVKALADHLVTISPFHGEKVMKPVKEALLMEKKDARFSLQGDLWGLHPALTMDVGLDLDEL